MIALLATILMALAWLGYETDWLRVRLPVGVTTQVIKQPNRKWQFLKYGDDALMLCSPKFCQSYSKCRTKTLDEYVWQIPARTVKAFGSTMSFNKGCNRQRVRLLRDIAKLQKSKALPTYKRALPPATWYPTEEASVELLVDGKSVVNINGDYKRGMIRDMLKPYTTKARVGRKAIIIPVGEADRVAN